MKKKKLVLPKKYHSRQIFLIVFFSILSSALTAMIVYLYITHSPLTSFVKKTDAALVNEGKEYEENGSPLDLLQKNKEQIGISSEVTYHGSRDKKQIALTFDAEMTDGMKANYLSGKVKSSYDKRITETLAQTNTKATLFLTGMWIELYPQVTKELAANPLFELASHSYADTSYDGYCFGLKQIKDSQDLEDIETTQKLLREVAGVENQYFRFPGGCFSQKDLEIVINQAGLKIIHWDVVGEDGFNQNTQGIIQNVVQNTQDGSIIVLHMNGEPTAPKTADALPEIISQLRAKGFEFVKISDLLAN